MALQDSLSNYKIEYQKIPRKFRENISSFVFSSLASFTAYSVAKYAGGVDSSTLNAINPILSSLYFTAVVDVAEVFTIRKDDSKGAIRGALRNDIGTLAGLILGQIAGSMV